VFNFQYPPNKKRPKSVGTFGTSAQRVDLNPTNAKEGEVEHLGPGSYNTEKYLAIKKDKKLGAGFGTSTRRPLTQTEEVPGPGNYKYDNYKSTQRNGYTIPKSEPKNKAPKDGGKHYTIKPTIPHTADYALPPPQDRKIKPPNF
jgi:hypothetical protein